MINFCPPQFKIQNSKFKITEASAKESQRAGAAEYVTKDERRLSEASAKDERRINIPPPIQNSQFKIHNLFNC